MRALRQRERRVFLRRLLTHLDAGGCPDGRHWQEWQIERITGGRNNLLCRATGPLGDLALKFTIHDERDRAGREYGALLALGRPGLRRDRAGHARGLQRGVRV